MEYISKAVGLTAKLVTASHICNRKPFLQAHSWLYIRNMLFHYLIFQYRHLREHSQWDLSSGPDVVPLLS